MITEDQLEQLAIQWFQDTGWNHVHGAVIAPEGVAAEREDRENIEHRTPNIEHRSEEKGLLVEAVRGLNPKLPESAVEEVPIFEYQA
jgi:type I restriction enzyme R subunit